ncbi:MAG: hypothetical protein HC916_20625 [Coleofasciculaceae cyanobacterium SM2_1_6]|nr:hypothetical protein [Coleofasciculaceae cyanobacterium SM2_1_6]
MATNIHQYGSGDNIAGDKVMGDKIGTQINNTELIQIINDLRQTAAQFPPDIQEGIIIDLDDVEKEIKKPENKRNLPRLKKCLAALLAAATLAGGAIASGVDFANNVVDLGSKVGIELKLPPAP